ncbi:MAG: sensor histidine kinase KdpD [Elusimicrobia bacterium]|nr:sensor histidine kinase KdpD [Elusimicrobiota bacterium]
MEPTRRNPEAFLAQAAREAGAAAGGRLKVFLGAAPGVGKTFTMLEAARSKRREGVAVLVGVAETHGRRETLALLEGLEVLARRTVEHRGIVLEEFDLDAGLARRPPLILVDELAHANAPGSRNAKRWQDVAELLGAGVDVYATLNVQHLESLNDVVARITGVTVRETVPDSVIEGADIELVDLPPEELLERLKAGKVYVPEQAARATEGFFRLSNLTALRELALRVTAQGVGKALESYRALQAPETIWPTAERILVCVGPGPNSPRLVRAARRMAASSRAEWAAAFIESERHPLDAADRARALETLRLAEGLGAQTETYSAAGVVEGLLELARRWNATKIVVGKSERPRWREFLGGGFVGELIRRSGDIEVVVLRGDPGTNAPSGFFPGTSDPSTWSGYAAAAAAAAATTAVCFAFSAFLELTNLVMVYLLGALLVAARGMRGPAMFYSVLSVLCFDFCFVPPRFTFVVADTHYLLTFLVMFLSAFLISHLTLRLRSNAESARQVEARTAVMHALSRQLASVRGIDALLDAGLRHLAQVFDCEAVALLPGGDGLLNVKAGSGQPPVLDDKERSVAQWVFDLGQPAGLGTQTLSVVDALYLPLQGGSGPTGVLRVRPRTGPRPFDADQRLILESLVRQIALALEVETLQEDVRATKLRAEAERLRSALLSSVSHDLRTPLSAIIGSAGSLLQGSFSSADAQGRALLEDILEEAKRLARLVQNLLETTRLESTGVELKKEPHPIEEVIGSALGRLEKELAGREVRTAVPEDLPLVPIDPVLLEQVFVNLLENAVRHTPPGTAVEVSAEAGGGELSVMVADRGPGVPPGELERIFDKFHRATAGGGGAGLGLAICKAVVAAHGGRIWAENREGGGAGFRFALPLGGGHVRE